MNDLRDFDRMANAFADVAAQMERKEVSAAAKKGAQIVLDAIVSQAPSDTGTLRKGLILHKERSRTGQKAVYDVYPDPKKNDIFQKYIKKPVRSKTKYGYYPASQEHGFFTRRADGGMTYTRPTGETQKMDKVPGKHYMLAGSVAVERAARTAILQQIIADVEKRLGK